MIRPHIRRFGMISRTLVSLTILSLLVLSLGPASLLAANTRDIFFGTPGSDNGVLTFSPVTVGGNTVVTLRIRNDGNQTVNHIKFAGGAYADGLSYNATNPKPGTASLGGSLIAAIFPSAGCDPAGPDSLLCDVGTLASGASATYTIVLTPPAIAGAYHVWFTASWNEGWSTTGSNADYVFAHGDIVVATADCDTPTANYFLPGQGVGLASACPGEQEASVAAGAFGGIGAFGQLGIDDGFAAGCPAGYSCFGSTVDAVISDGQPVAGGVQWTVKWYGTKSLKGVIHFHDGYDATTNPNAYDVILFQKKFQCSNSLTTNCWISTASSKGNADPLTFEAVFVTPNNGKAGGFI